MSVYLVQHGATGPGNDPDRPLTEESAAGVRELARLATSSVRVDKVMHSGLVRAEQTAQIWAEQLQVELEATTDLTSPDDPAVWASRLDGETQGLMLVGHKPHLPRLASLLLASDAEAGLVLFQQGGLVELTKSDSRWTVSLVLPPRFG